MAGWNRRTFSKPTENTHAPVGEVRTSVTVAGDVSGQLAVGSHIVQMRVDTVLGNLVTVLPPDAKVNVTPRPVPISLVPRRPALLIGRQNETASAVEALSTRRAVEIYAPAGMGKSTLLRSLAHQLPVAEACGGMAHLSARGLSHDDLLHVLFDVFYSSDIPVKPPLGELRHRLQHVRAALLLDDVDLTENDIEDVEDYAPECGFVLTTQSDPGVGEALTIPLTGLRGDDARELLAHALGRPLGPEEQPAVDAICDLVQGAPAGLLRLAAAARQHDGSLADFAATAASLRCSAPPGGVRRGRADARPARGDPRRAPRRSPVVGAHRHGRRAGAHRPAGRARAGPRVGPAGVQPCPRRLQPRRRRRPRARRRLADEPAARGAAGLLPEAVGRAQRDAAGARRAPGDPARPALRRRETPRLAVRPRARRPARRGVRVERSLGRLAGGLRGPCWWPPRRWATPAPRPWRCTSWAPGRCARDRRRPRRRCCNPRWTCGRRSATSRRPR